MDPVHQRLHNEYAELPPQERRLADFILDHPEDLPLFNSAELARLCGVSKATVSRLFKRLGFSSFREGRQLFRQLRQQGVPIPDAAVTGGGLMERHLEREIGNLNRLYSGLDSRRLNEIVDQLGRARNLVVIGFRNSYPVALHLRQQLCQVRDGVRVAPQPGQSIGEELAGLDAEDLVVLCGFRRRPRNFPAILQALRSQRVPVLLLADGSARGLAEQVRWWLEVPLDSLSAFDCYSGAMSLINMLVNLLLHQQLRSGRARINEISEQYRLLDELSLDLPSTGP